MSKEEKTPKVAILKINEILSQEKILKFDEEAKLTIPDYQRPYKWDIKNVYQLIDDILDNKDKSSYRLGTLVLHKDTNGLNVVDGQQRLITISLILQMLNENIKDNKVNLDNLNFGIQDDISKQNIYINYQALKQKSKDFNIEELGKALLEKCEFVVIVLEDIGEAFQFFDSQNSRGKSLEVHDLLKAFHLRSMRDIDSEEKTKYVDDWEKLDTEKLSEFFSFYMYRIKKFIRHEKIEWFSKKDIDLFKGMDLDGHLYPFARRLKYLEFESKMQLDKLGKEYAILPFFLESPTVNGKSFFDMFHHYHDMKNTLEKREDSNGIMQTINNYEGSHRTGDRYIKEMFFCALMYYVDKFGYEDIDKAIEKIFIWAWSLRLIKGRVGIPTISNYVLWEYDLFNIIKNSVNHKDVLNLTFEKIEVTMEVKDIVAIFKDLGVKYESTKAK